MKETRILVVEDDPNLLETLRYSLQKEGYQVATAALSPADIAAPIRQILRDMKRCQVMLGDVSAIDLKGKRVTVGEDTIGYDALILAAGVTHAYFGNEAWSLRAPGLKTIEDALDIRRRVLLAFEAAELEDDAAARADELTFVVVGGGPTGVEMAGALREIEPAREGAQAGMMPGSHGRDRAGVHPAAEVRADRDVAHQLTPHRGDKAPGADCSMVA